MQPASPPLSAPSPPLCCKVRQWHISVHSRKGRDGGRCRFASSSSFLIVLVDWLKLGKRADAACRWIMIVSPATVLLGLWGRLVLRVGSGGSSSNNNSSSKVASCSSSHVTYTQEWMDGRVQRTPI